MVRGLSIWFTLGLEGQVGMLIGLVLVSNMLWCVGKGGGTVQDLGMV